MQRPSVDQYMLAIATAAASRATCPRLSVGAVVAIGGRVAACGYNGAPSHYPECTDVGCLMVNGGCLRAVHAERNAMEFARLAGYDLRQCSLYLTHCPCEDCTKDIIRYQVQRVVYQGGYRTSDISLAMLEKAGVKHEQINAD